MQKGGTSARRSRWVTELFKGRRRDRRPFALMDRWPCSGGSSRTIKPGCRPDDLWLNWSTASPGLYVACSIAGVTMSFRRKVALTLACILVMLLATAALVPFLFRDKIEARVKDAASANINARVDWQDLDIGLLRTFPHLSLRLHQLNITGVDAFAGDTLLGVPRFQVVIDLRSVLGGLRGEKPLVIRSVALERPQVHLLVKPDGSANWNIMRPRADTTASGRSLDVSLKKLSITDALITFDNEAADVHSRLAGLDHSLSGDFGKQQFGLVTQTTIDTAWVRFAGIPYLSNAKIEADVALDVD
ncbi:MAG TPA: AsmA family protein, partial [Steroidobacteraceae bacterium]